jgi:hypothetical protein
MNTEVPEWMKPSKSGVILTGKQREGPDGTKQTYLEVLELGKKIDSTVLNWLFRLYLKTGVPMKIQIGGGYNLYGNDSFFDMHTG